MPLKAGYRLAVPYEPGEEQGHGVYQVIPSDPNGLSTWGAAAPIYLFKGRSGLLFCFSCSL